MSDPEKTGRDTDGRDPETGRFLPGNPGKPKGARNKRSKAVLLAMEEAGEDVANAAIKRALEGDTAAMRLVLERIAPPRKDAALEGLELPAMTCSADAARAMGALLSAVAFGELAPSEAQAVSGLIESYRKALEVEELERRIEALERRAK